MAKKRSKRSANKSEKLPPILDVSSDDSVNFYDDIDKHDQHDFIPLSDAQNRKDNEFIAENMSNGSNTSDESIDDKAISEDEGAGKSWGNDLRNFYATEKRVSKKNDNDDDYEDLEYKEAENYRKRLNLCVSEEDFNLNIFNPISFPHNEKNESKINCDSESDNEIVINNFTDDRFIKSTVDKYVAELSNLNESSSNSDKCLNFYRKSIESFLQQIKKYQNCKNDEDLKQLNMDFKALKALECTSSILKALSNHEDSEEDIEFDDDTSNEDFQGSAATQKILDTDFGTKTSKRPINYMIEKNKILFKKSKKSSRNPRVKNKLKYKKALKKHLRNVKPCVTENKKYGGEATGIRKNVIHSVKLN